MQKITIFFFGLISALAWAPAAAWAQGKTVHPSPPLLSFPERGLDDAAAYQGYQTRFHRDAAGNTIQIYLDGRSGRIVHLWADAEDESLGLTIRDSSGRAAPLQWGAGDGRASVSGRTRTFAYHLVAGAKSIDAGLFLLGSMRVERDFQYGEHHTRPFTTPAFTVAELGRMLDALETFPPAERRRQLALLNAASIDALRARLRPVVTSRVNAGAFRARVVQPSFDARDTLTLELSAPSGRVRSTASGDVVTLATSSNETPFTLRITTTGKALSPLGRKEIFTPEFLRFLASVRGTDSMSLRSRWLEREVRGVELLSSREKLMAGLPAYATYFGRDMLVSALMMRPIWRSDMSAFVIASVLRKLGPAGDVSHEEALGGQADREAASEYAGAVDSYRRAERAGDRRAADSLLARATSVVRDHRRVRENYHMIDDEFQLPVLEALWLGDSTVSRERKRAFLLDATDGEARVRRMLRELALVARLVAPYVADPVATHLVSFPRRADGTWQSASWRDSEDGYAGGRFAMDVNAIWAPHALEATRVILNALRDAGLAPDSVLRAMHDDAATAPLSRFARDAGALQHAIDLWNGVAKHFTVRLDASEVRARVDARVAALPAAERQYWTRLVSSTHADRDSLVFLAISLDAGGSPIGVANTDPATRLFLLRRAPDSSHAAVLRDVQLFERPYPVGLFIEGVGPAVANDAYAPPAVWPRFERDRYHGPRVVWGREVNLFLLGVMNQLSSTRDAAYADELRGAVARVRSAVDASGFHSELWSYELRDGGIVPLRYGTGSDVQLWSTTDLAVQFALSRLR